MRCTSHSRASGSSGGSYTSSSCKKYGNFCNAGKHSLHLHHLSYQPSWKKTVLRPPSRSTRARIDSPSGRGGGAMHVSDVVASPLLSRISSTVGARTGEEDGGPGGKGGGGEDAAEDALGEWARRGFFGDRYVVKAPLSSSSSSSLRFSLLTSTAACDSGSDSSFGLSSGALGLALAGAGGASSSGWAGGAICPSTFDSWSRIMTPLLGTPAHRSMMARTLAFSLTHFAQTIRSKSSVSSGLPSESDGNPCRHSVRQE